MSLDTYIYVLVVISGLMEGRKERLHLFLMVAREVICKS